ncbi:MAG: hypothetical protein WEA58_15365 [Balneolaceae bacterium]
MKNRKLKIAVFFILIALIMWGARYTVFLEIADTTEEITDSQECAVASFIKNVTDEERHELTIIDADWFIDMANSVFSILNMKEFYTVLDEEDISHTVQINDIYGSDIVIISQVGTGNSSEFSFPIDNRLYVDSGSFTTVQTKQLGDGNSVEITEGSGEFGSEMDIRQDGSFNEYVIEQQGFGSVLTEQKEIITT